MFDTQVIVTTKRCFHCGETGELVLGAQEAEFGESLRARGGLIQECYPNLPKAEREQIMTGTHGACWDEMFSFGDDDYDYNDGLYE